MGRRLGRYELLGKIAQGGMAEVWLARQSGPQGFSKLAVIKQILPELAEDQKFVQMFLDEARLAALLNHPNVVHIYELGEDDQNGAAYTAMEYIDGVTLKRLAEKAAETGTHLPFELVGRILSDACAGINFAHELKNLEGQPLNLVHRDISPDNILITYSGQVKIVDFGIARAATATSDRTRSGVFKGKLAYASPEYLEGRPFDRRADIWALGVTLYWTLTGKKPFPAMAPEALRQQIAGGTFVPPRDVDGDIPWELEEIVTQALEKNPDQRYQTARELQDAVDKWTRAYGKDASSRWLSDYMNKLFPEQRDPERLRLRAMTMRASNTRPNFDADPEEKTGPGEDLSQETRDELAAAPKTPRRPSSPSGSNRVPPGQSGSSRSPSGPSRAPPPLPGASGPNTPSGQSLGDILFDAATSTAIGAGRIDLDQPKPDFRPASTGAAPLLEGPPTTTGIRRDDIYEEPPPRRSLKIVGAVAVVAVLVVGAGAVIAATRTPPRHPAVFPRPAPTGAAPVPAVGPSGASAPPQALPAAPSGPITVAAPPQAAATNPAQTPKLAPPPEPVAAPAPQPPAPAPPAPVVVSPPPVRTHSKEGTRRPRPSPAAASGPGELSVLVAPWADVFVDGQKVGTTPFAPIELPAGRHEVRLENGPLHVVRKMTVQIRPAKTAVVKATLQNIADDDE